MPIRVSRVGDVTTVITTTFYEDAKFGTVEHVTIDVSKKPDDAASARFNQLAIMKESEMGKNPYTGDTSINSLPDFPILNPVFTED